MQKPRTPAQVAALEAARKKAVLVRLQKKAERESQKQAPESVDDDATEPEPEIEYVRKAKKPKAKKRVIVVEESSSSEEELEVRIPKRRSTRDRAEAADDRFQQSMQKMFTLS